MKSFARLTLCLAALAPSLALATDQVIPYQGYLDQGGTPANGAFTFRVALITSEAQDVSCLSAETPALNCAPWFDTYAAVEVRNGRFALQLGGPARPINADLFRTTPFVAVAVRGPQDPGFFLLAGRQRVGAVPYAIVPEVGAPPIGAIIAWHPQHTNVPQTLSPESGWVRCDGQQLNDPASPLNGTFLPNLNASGLFLRGGLLSGTVQGDQMRAHRHNDSGHQHTVPRPPYFDVEMTGGGAIRRPEGYDGTIRTQATNVASASLGDAVDLAGNATIPTGDENRPRNMAVVWIMRVK